MSADRELCPTDRLADIRILSPVSIIVPTFREAENIPHLVARLDALRQAYGLDLEVLIMDDKSDDGTPEAVASLGHDWVKLIVREGPRGLSPAVVDGLREARHPVLVVMDADLSHPPERIPAMILALEAGQQFVIGSRYVPGGSTDDAWGFGRWLNSKIATLLARPFTDAEDPMAGFFALRKSDFDKAERLSPVGYKIGLELIVKCHLENIGEVPIHFSDRQHGESKLSFTEQLRYIQHVGRLLRYKLTRSERTAQFALAGVAGVAVNLLTLAGLLQVGSPLPVAVIGAVALSLLVNLLIHTTFATRRSHHTPAGRWFVAFAQAFLPGAAVNTLVVLLLAGTVSGLSIYLAALAGIAVGAGFNSLRHGFVAFRHAHG